MSAERTSNSQTYKQIIWHRFNKNRMAVWALRILYVLIFIALSADFIANEKAIYYKKDGEHHFPVMRSCLTKLGLVKYKNDVLDYKQLAEDGTFVIFPPITYSPSSLDTDNIYVGPWDKQKLRSERYRHYLGTMKLGKDVAAAMIHGTRVAMLVGLVSMSIASFIGIFLGSIAGYFGDRHFKISRIRLFLNIIGILIASFYLFIVQHYTILEAGESGHLMGTLSFLCFKLLLLFIALNIMVHFLKKVKPLAHKVRIPVDLIIMRLIEVFTSIPGLLFLLAVLAIVKVSSIMIVMIVIGLLKWTSIARYIRSELLAIRELEYIKAAQAMGFSEFRTIWRHALPNALGPVLIAIAFGIASAILLEATLSFIGIGGGPDEMTWGRLLAEGRLKASAWWLAIIPGVAIFVTVTIFNLIGEGLTDAMSRK